MENKPFVFLHTPKAGGTSIVEFLRINFPARDIYPIHYVDQVNKEEYYRVIKRDIRNRKSLIYGHIGHYVHNYLDMGVEYGMVFRDPVERIASFFRFLYLDYTSVNLHWEMISSSDPVATILATDFEEHNLMTKILSGHTNLEGPATAEMFSKAKDNIQRLKVISIAERMNISLLLLTKILDLRFPMPFYENKSSRNLSDQISEDIAKRESDIRELNYYDMQIYDLACGIFSDMVGKFTFSEEPIIDATNATLNKMKEIKTYDLKMMFEFLVEDDKFRKDMLVELTTLREDIDGSKPHVDFGLGSLIKLKPNADNCVTLKSREFYGRGHKIIELLIISTTGTMPKIKCAEFMIFSEEEKLDRLNSIDGKFSLIIVQDGYLAIGELAEGIWGLSSIQIKILFENSSRSRGRGAELLIERVGVYSP